MGFNRGWGGGGGEGGGMGAESNGLHLRLGM